jgi:hypothetical protein
VNSTYSVFGLTVSSNLDLPGLRTVAASPFPPDINVYLGALPLLSSAADLSSGEVSYSSAQSGDSGKPLVCIWHVLGGAFIRVEFDEGITFWLDRAACDMWATWCSPLTLEDVASYLLGPIFGLLLRMRGSVCLHASAVSIGNRAVAFVGPEGAGKSTAAAAFTARGHAVLSDDIVALVEREGAFHVLPAYPYLGLWPDSVEAIFGSADVAPCFSETWDKRRLALGDSRLRFETKPSALCGIFLLGAQHAGPAVIHGASGREALLTLVANSYATNTLDSQARAKELGILGRLVSAVPIFNLYASSDSSRVTELCECVSHAMTSSITSRSVAGTRL